MKHLLILSIVISALALGCTPPAPPTPVTLTQIDVQLYAGAGVTGTLTIEVRNTTGATPALWSTTVDTGDFPAVYSWYSCSVPDLTLYSGRTYRIYMTRSDSHDLTAANTITWRSTLGVVDEYPQLKSSGGTHDFVFKTYIDGVINQSVEPTDIYGYSVYSTDYWWQEFVPVE